MIDPPATSPDPDPEPGAEADEQVRLLLAYDDALSAGLAATSDLDSLLIDAGGGPSGPLGQALRVIQAIHRRWPWTGADPTGDTLHADGAGIRLGRYEIRGAIGRGGHGIVFLAFDPALRRDVALKIQRPGSSGSPRRFLREARATARLDHPGIVPIHDFGMVGSTRYIAAAYIDGPNLSQWLAHRGGAIEPALAARITRQIAEAVAHAHDRGVLHRDLKPSNVLIDGDRPKLTDFGLAKLIDEAGEETATGSPLGTPRYMAPEQLLGRGDRIGPWTDVYGLGAILHTLLRGEAPPGPGAGRHDGPDGLWAIVDRCLRADPPHRYGSAAELVDDLDRFLRGVPVRASSAARPTRRLVLAGASGLAIAGLALGVARGRRPDRDGATPGPAVDAPFVVRRPSLTLRHDRDDVYMARFSPDGTTIATAGMDGTVRLWDARSGVPQAVLRHRAEVNAIDWSADGRSLATVSDDGTAWIWDIASRLPAREPWTAHPGVEAISVVFADRGGRVVTGGRDGRLALWDAIDAALIAELSIGDATIESLARFPNGSEIVASDSIGRVMALDPALNLIRTWPVPTPGPRYKTIRCVAPSRLGYELLAVSTSEAVYSCEPGGGIQILAGRHEGGVMSVAYAPLLHHYATAGTEHDPTIRLWRIYSETRRHLVGVYECHTSRIWNVTVSPDARWLASASRDSTARVWPVRGIDSD